MMSDKFVNSSLHNGLQHLFISRLLRPFRFRSVVTMPNPANGGGSGSKRSADGAIRNGGRSQLTSTQALEIFDLETLRAPLESLRASIRAAFPRAVGKTWRRLLAERVLRRREGEGEFEEALSPRPSVSGTRGQSQERPSKCTQPSGLSQGPRRWFALRESCAAPLEKAPGPRFPGRRSTEFRCVSL